MTNEADIEPEWKIDMSFSQEIQQLISRGEALCVGLAGLRLAGAGLRPWFQRQPGFEPRPPRGARPESLRKSPGATAVFKTVPVGPARAGGKNSV